MHNIICIRFTFCLLDQLLKSWVGHSLSSLMAPFSSLSPPLHCVGLLFWGDMLFQGPRPCLLSDTITAGSSSNMEEVVGCTTTNRPCALSSLLWGVTVWFWSGLNCLFIGFLVSWRWGGFGMASFGGVFGWGSFSRGRLVLTWFYM